MVVNKDRGWGVKLFDTAIQHQIVKIGPELTELEKSVKNNYGNRQVFKDRHY
jgi:hypothetical protein